jgi:hypothetical protein
LRHGSRGPKGLEVFPDKMGRPVTDRRCHNCLRAVPPVEWRGAELTGEERVTASRNGGAQRRYRVQCTRCGYEWWSTSPAVKLVANEMEPEIVPMDEETRKRMAARLGTRRSKFEPSVVQPAIDNNDFTEPT